MPTRIGIGVLVFLLGITILLKRLGTHSVQTIGFPLDVVVAVLVMIGGIALPVVATTRERSYFFVVAGDFAVAVIVLAEANPDQRLLGCLVFGLVGSYIAFFHNLRTQLWHLLFSGAVIVVAASACSPMYLLAFQTSWGALPLPFLSSLSYRWSRRLLWRF
ncbi:hypothetical protein ACQGAO_12660 [Rhodococcus sp. 1.20]